jgi:Rho-binding antiterminator
MSSNVFPSTKTRLLLGPLRQPQLPANPYQPVDCDFTDDLEFVSIKKILIEVKYWNAEAKIAECQARIDDILTQNKEEFLIMSNGTKIRLDRIFEIGIIDG